MPSSGKRRQKPAGRFLPEPGNMRRKELSFLRRTLNGRGRQVSDRIRKASFCGEL
ncbi:hypothetical protein B4135_2122 [Caldibacillus debilis]|uniref:Uncharacterized protein n=1 Tax=Caldibacillus debilis TaxID=301148 RepID=A0A150M3U4_9BACI|nr:hypothetical protein B4135_2122 [Caldibacillus debilis]